MSGQRLSRDERYTLAVRRLTRNLDALGVANMRTLEMKVSDSGPDAQRVDPHVLTRARRDLEEAGRIVRKKDLWFHRTNESKARVDERLAVLEPIHRRLTDGTFTSRMGQTLEIAIFRALVRSKLNYVGGFLDLDEHDDSTRYSKEEPPLHFAGRKMPGKKLFDFIAFDPTGPIGIEAKNVREWIYPNREEVRELLLKAVAADTLPVLIARRIPYVTFRLLQTAGVMLFQTYNQLYPTADRDLAELVKDRDTFGFHDVRVGNEPNANLAHFLQETIPANAAEYRDRFNRYGDLLQQFASGELSYVEFSARVRRRENGSDENSDFPREEEYDPDDFGRDC